MTMTQTALMVKRDYETPVRRLHTTLSDILDTNHQHRTPEQTLILLKTAMDEFVDETSDWF